MFSFRRDKTGFFVTIILLTILGGTLISTLVLLIVGMAQGNWQEHLLSIKWVLGSAWVACIVTVLIRVRIYKWQADRALARQKEEDKALDGNQETNVSA
jgi:membrane protein DedA with SNARE-associated domain